MPKRVRHDGWGGAHAQARHPELVSGSLVRCRNEFGMTAGEAHTHKRVTLNLFQGLWWDAETSSA
jgi:hypothetical protein